MTSGGRTRGSDRRPDHPRALELPARRAHERQTWGVLNVRRLRLEEADGAVGVWLAANEARDRLPLSARQARVRDKITDPSALSMIALRQALIIGMVLGEPGRHANGAGPPDPLLLHVSMVFVHPAHWGRGVGRALLDALFSQARCDGYARATLWTGDENSRARRLYSRCGLRPTGQTKTLASHGLVVQFGADLEA
jgi:GNAT superfamily N-acetyltransferase